MNFVTLSPHFPPNYKNFAYRLREAGVNVLGIADAPYVELGPELQAAVSEYFRVDDMQDYNQMLRALGFLTWRHGRIDRIESHNEYWLETEAALRTDFNIPGPKQDTIERVKRKSVMKEVFRKAGVNVARGKVVHTQKEAEALAKELGYPLIVKPDIGVGAAGAAKLSNHKELVEFFSNKPPIDYIVEEFIEGTLLSFDGLAGRDGEIVFFTSHIFRQGILETVQANEDMFYYSVRDLPADLEKVGRASVAAFGISERFFHIEFFRRHKDKKLVAVEVNMRPPGGLTTDMFNFANEFDVYREYANVIARGSFEAEWSRPYHCMYIGRKNHIAYVHPHEDVLKQADGLIVHHERVQSVFSRAIGDYAYIACSPELPPLVELTRYALES
ncbi:MAG: ATP-grasp domain-containing protein [Candidatus Xenobia bacterium]